MFPRVLNPDQCQEVVPTKGMMMDYHQCHRKVKVVEADGTKHCSVHSEAAQYLRRAKGQAKFDREIEAIKFQHECVGAVMDYAGKTPQLVKFLHDYTFKQALLGEPGAITLMTAIERAKRLYAISTRVRV